MKYIWIGGIVLAVLAAALFVPKYFAVTEEVAATPEVSEVEPTGVIHEVVLTPDGYEPSEITIGVGDTIRFSASESYGRLHWPASNIHPSHEIYPEFDPLRPIEPEDTWSFVFGKKGEWRFHDHLAPYHTGTITVQ